MSFIGDYFSHKNAVKGRIEQLEGLNDVINERKEEARIAGEELNFLETRIAEIKSKYPDLSEEEALIKYFTSLKAQNEALEKDIALNTEKLSSLKAKLNIVLELDKIATEKEKIEKELIDLTERKKSLVKVEDIIFAIYTLNSGEAVANAFIYVGDTDYKNAIKTYPGKYYKSISGDRVIGLNLKLTEYFTSKSGKLYMGYVANTEPNLWFTFVDVCMTLDSPLYMNEKVSLKEINEVLQLFINSNDFIKKNDRVIVKRRSKV